MKQQKQDRRSQRTRQLIMAALSELLREKRYDTITIQDILERAGIGRSTFYTHYFDKEDAMVDLMEHIMDTLEPHLSPSQGEQGILPGLEMFRHVQENYQVMSGLMRGYGAETFWKLGQAVWSKKIEQALAAIRPEKQATALPLPVAAQYLTGAFANLLKWWVEAEMPYTPEEMERFFRQLALPGVRAAVGSDTIVREKE